LALLTKEQNCPCTPETDLAHTVAQISSNFDSISARFCHYFPQYSGRISAAICSPQNASMQGPRVQKNLQKLRHIIFELYINFNYTI
jgi:hypothetical protein